jgi:hypothetical protein
MMIRPKSVHPVLAALAAIAVVLSLAAVPHAAVAESNRANDTARILAGMPVAAESPLAPLMREPAWQQHARALDSAWSDLERRQLSRIRAWSAANITAAQPTAYYMFSGPDYLYADAFLPNRSTFVLCALEQVGSIPLLTEASRRSMSYGLPGLRSSISTVLSYSFFITKKMRATFGTNTYRGALPIIYVFLARSGKTIKEVSLVSIKEDGTLVPASDEGASATAPGAKIVFSGSDGKPQTLYYFRTDISDDGLKKSGFLAFAGSLGKGDSFLKSASYLPHADSFSKIREFLLTQSQSIVQDDSGIPLRFFKPDEWRLRPFGRYLGPIGEFPGRYQKGLNDLFHKANAPRIDFGVGYRWRPNESNLLLAEKKAR